MTEIWKDVVGFEINVLAQEYRKKLNEIKNEKL